MSIKTDILEDDGQSGPNNVVKRDPDEDELDELVKFAGHEVGLLEGVLDKEQLAQHSSSDKWEWEHFQFDYLDCDENFICNKARRVGLSTAFAGKAFARGILSNHTDYTAIFVSHKQEDAEKKVEYVRNFLEALPPRFQKNIVRNPLKLIEWENNNGTRTKIVSHPQKPVRGDDGDIFLDEFAHYQYDHKIWESVLNATGMGDYSIDITSTPFGKSGLFYEMMERPHKFPDFHREWIFWWNCKRYLKRDEDEYLAFVEQKMNNDELHYQDNIEDRVKTFGNESLRKLFRNNTIESFKQELEAHFIDKEASFISKELIMDNMYLDEDDSVDHYNPKENDFKEFSPEDAVKKEKWPIEERYNGQNFRTFNQPRSSKTDHPEQLYRAKERGEISGKLVGGVDLGTKRHSTEFIVLEEVEVGDGKTLQIERFRLSKKDWKLPKQQHYFERVLREGYVRKLRIDTTGLGTQLGQYLGDIFSNKRFEPVTLNSAKKKDREMTNLKHRLRENTLAMAYDENKVLDIHSINRVVTASKNITYRASERNKSHADYAWALALASLAGTPLGESQFNNVKEDLTEFEIDKSKDKNPANAPYVENFNENLNKSLGGEIQGPDPFEEKIAQGFDDPGDFIGDL